MVNLENDRGFIIKQYYLHCYETFWGSTNQATRVYARESCSSNMVSESCPKNLVMSIECSNVKPKYRESRRHSFFFFENEKIHNKILLTIKIWSVILKNIFGQIIIIII